MKNITNNFIELTNKELSSTTGGWGLGDLITIYDAIENFGEGLGKSLITPQD